MLANGEKDEFEGLQQSGKVKLILNMLLYLIFSYMYSIHTVMVNAFKFKENVTAKEQLNLWDRLEHREMTYSYNQT